MNLSTLFGLARPAKPLSPKTLALLRVLQSILLGALTTVFVTAMSFITTHSTGFTLTSLALCLVKTFIDSFGHGFAKYVRDTGDQQLANDLDKTTDDVNRFIPPSEYTKSEVGNMPK